MLKKKKVLIVDDDFYITLSLSRLLSCKGYPCLVANDAKTALQIAEAEMPALIFLDLDMPGEDGYELLKKIKKEPGLKNIYIAILSAMGLDINKQKARDLGADEFIDKPFDPMYIFQLVEKVLS